jgi:hypothetical protein
MHRIFVHFFPMLLKGLKTSPSRSSHYFTLLIYCGTTLIAFTPDSPADPGGWIRVFHAVAGIIIGWLFPPCPGQEGEGELLDTFTRLRLQEPFFTSKHPFFPDRTPGKNVTKKKIMLAWPDRSLS